jgi:hypothetical protein
MWFRRHFFTRFDVEGVRIDAEPFSDRRPRRL